MKKLGIAVTTYNRRDMLLSHLNKIQQLTSQPFDLVVCDDGSSDGTREALAARGITVLGGVNKGIAWNKNRGLFYLINVCRSDVVLLLDDDVYPTVHGWEQEWIEAVARVGHVNHLLPSYDFTRLSGGLTARDLGIGPIVNGICLAMSREAQSFIGYMDTRFGRYGHEHSDLTGRFRRAGFGGFDGLVSGQKRAFYYLLRGGLAMADAATSGTPEDLERNMQLLGQLSEEPIYRAPWRTDAEMWEFRAEVDPGAVADLKAPVPPGMQFSGTTYLKNNLDVAAAGFDPLLHYLKFGMNEGRSVTWEVNVSY